MTGTSGKIEPDYQDDFRITALVAVRGIGKREALTRLAEVSQQKRHRGRR